MNKKKVKEMMERFSFAQMTSNSNGKTSMSGCMGGLLCTASAIGFIWGAFNKQAELINQAVAYAVIGAGLLGYRKSQQAKETLLEESGISSEVEAPSTEPKEVNKDESLNS